MISALIASEMVVRSRFMLSWARKRFIFRGRIPIKPIVLMFKIHTSVRLSFVQEGHIIRNCYRQVRNCRYHNTLLVL